MRVQGDLRSNQKGMAANSWLCPEGHGFKEPEVPDIRESWPL